MSESAPELPNVEFSDEAISEDGFITIWNAAAASAGGNPETTRALACRLLLFLCKKDCDFVVTSSTTAEYLDSQFEKDNKVLYDWKPDSEKVDLIAQSAEVPAKALREYLKNEKFDPSVNHSATRAKRVEWFQNRWSVG